MGFFLMLLLLLALLLVSILGLEEEEEEACLAGWLACEDDLARFVAVATLRFLSEALRVMVLLRQIGQLTVDGREGGKESRRE